MNLTGVKNISSAKPRLVDLSKIKIPQPVVVKQKFNLNKWILIIFILFTIFFLFNCKYGIFKYEENHFALL